MDDEISAAVVEVLQEFAQWQDPADRAMRARRNLDRCMRHGFRVEAAVWGGALEWASTSHVPLDERPDVIDLLGETE